MSKTPPEGQAFGAAPHETAGAAHLDSRLLRISRHRRRPAARRRRSPFVQGASHRSAGAASTQRWISTPARVTPNLLIVETRLHGQAALDELERLAEVCDPATKVVVVGRTNDVELYRELMRRGASEYLVAPLSPLQLIEVISGLYLDPGAAPIGRVVAFIGARGGAGSSTLAP